MRSRVFNIRIPDDLLKKIDASAKSRFISKSDFIREAVAKYINDLDESKSSKQPSWQELADYFEEA